MQLIDTLRKRGFRITASRKALCAVLEAAQGPLGVPELLDRMTQKGVTPHKTTLYRDVATFVGEGFIEEIRLLDGVLRYELSDDHHHHAVCRNCGVVAELEADDEDFEKREALVAKKSGFTHITHALVYYGFCGACR
ncbi:transcriptional repressor [Patescibacteria group bacterium]|nr:transcriptional repressor [Patescibacteria group bacterium]